jgi:hypothetical protein
MRLSDRVGAWTALGDRTRFPNSPLLRENEAAGPPPCSLRNATAVVRAIGLADVPNDVVARRHLNFSSCSCALMLLRRFGFRFASAASGDNSCVGVARQTEDTGPLMADSSIFLLLAAEGTAPLLTDPISRSRRRLCKASIEIAPLVLAGPSLGSDASARDKAARRFLSENASPGSE